jgi:hypothetical protein
MTFLASWLLTALLTSTSALAGGDDHDDHDDDGRDHVTLHSSTMFGGPTQDGALIYVRNVSHRPVKLGDRKIVDEAGMRLQIGVDTCGSVLAPQMTCTIEAEVVPGRAYAASLMLRDAWAAQVRAQLELRDSFATGVGPLARDNLR